MLKKEFQWLPHLENSIPESTTGYSISFYAIALEGWRRGLTLKFINKNRRQSELLFELASKENSHQFVVSRGSLITREAMRICRNKIETKKYLETNNVATPKGKLYSKDIKDEDIIAFANTLEYPLVIKPSDGTGGRGVIAGIKNEKTFKESLNYIRKDLGYDNVIVEEHFQGEDLRVYVIDNKVEGVIKRIPANVLGDGISTVSELIKEKNKYRQTLPNLTSSLIKIDQELKNKLSEINYTLSSVPPEGKRVYLKSKNNTSAGGDSVEITNDLSDEIKQVAIDGVNAIPGLPHAGVDLMVDLKRNKATIIEINTQANIGSLLFPMIGTAKDIPAKLIDYYFPETKNIEREKSLYFKVNNVQQLFRNGKLKEYVYPTIPEGEVIKTRFLISGKLRGVGYGAWIRRKARDLNLNGYVRFLENGKVSIVVAGEKAQVQKFRVTINNETSKEAVVQNVEEKKRTTPVQLGFEILNSHLDKKIEDGYYPVRLKGISKLGQKKGRKKNKVKGKKINEYEKKYNQVINSKSWKITKPIRLVTNIIKQKNRH